MCGRFVSSSPPDELAKYFAVEEVAEQVLEPSYNVAPTQDIYVVFESGGVRRLDAFHWGLVPFWAKDPSTGNKMINARADSVTSKNTYKRAFAKRRCLIPADGFYEWMKVPGQKAKQPMYVQRTDGEPLALAGLWERWRPKDAPDGDDSQLVRSCTIITGEPNEKMAEIHDRMPAMLPPSVWAAWLDPTNDDLDTLGKLLVPAPSELITIYPVSTAVNNVRTDGPELIEPAEPAPAAAAELNLEVDAPDVR
ncbi:MAG: SOS response-associated peptidase [Acidimicrobiales bacterium]